MSFSFDVAGKLVHTVGTPVFADALMCAGKELIGADYCSLFVFPEESGPKCLASSGVGSDRLALMASGRYLGTHWRKDPTINALPVRRRADAMFFVGLDDLGGDDHYQECFQALNIGDRIVLIYGGAAFFLRLSFYRYQKRPPFSQREIEIARTAAGFFEKAVYKHYRLITASGSDALRGIPDVEQMQLRLKALNFGLSAREIEVCSKILLGLTAEGIALDTGISKTSVVTYRKRAYAKLGIATQNELFSLCLSSR